MTVLVFVLAKIVFMLANKEGHSFMPADIWDVIRHGLSLDGSTALYFLSVPLLMVIATIWVKGAKARKVMKRIMSVYFIIVSLAFSLAFIADTSLYPFWGFKLDASCLQYLETPTEAMASVSVGYIILRFLLFLVIAFLINKMFPDLPESDGKITPLARKLSETVLYVCFIPLMVIGIRGGVDESTTNVGQVYYSQNAFLNHSAVNPVFSFLSSFEKSANNIVSYDYYPEEECRKLIETLYPIPDSLQQNQVLNPQDSLLRNSRPNVVVILMESAGEIIAEAMPHLQQYKREGINFSQCYANSWRTDRGTVCTYSGYPSFPTSSVMKMPKKSRTLPSIASSLKKEGYSTHYLYGGDINFTNMRSYLISSGFETLTWKKDYTAEEQNTNKKWGVRDDITFQTLYDLVMEKSGKGTPFFLGYSTLSSHEPWVSTFHKFDDKILNSFYFLDDCLWRFIERVKKTPAWENLLIILLPDHSISYRGVEEDEAIRRNLMPMVWIGGAVKGPRDINVICNQTDLPATLLSQLGMDTGKFRWSRNVVSKDYRYPFAVHNYNNGFSVIDSTGFIVYDLDSDRLIASRSNGGKRLEKIGKTILQATTKDLSER